MNMFEFYISLQSFYRYRVRHCLVFFLFIKELKDSLGRRRGELKHIGHLRHLLNRLREITHVLDKRLNISDFNRVSDCQEPSEDGNSHISQISDELHDRHHHS